MNKKAKLEKIIKFQPAHNKVKEQAIKQVKSASKSAKEELNESKPQ